MAGLGSSRFPQTQHRYLQPGRSLGALWSPGKESGLIALGAQSPHPCSSHQVFRTGVPKQVCLVGHHSFPDSLCVLSPLGPISWMTETQEDNPSMCVEGWDGGVALSRGTRGGVPHSGLTH